MEIKSFRDLRVWQAGMELVESLYGLSAKFPRHELCGLSSQIQRAAVSVPSNIAEGHARESTKEYLQHLSISQASLAEVETQIEIALRLNYISDQELNDLITKISALRRQRFALRNSLMNPKATSASPGS